MVLMDALPKISSIIIQLELLNSSFNFTVQFLFYLCTIGPYFQVTSNYFYFSRRTS